MKVLGAAVIPVGDEPNGEWEVFEGDRVVVASASLDALPLTLLLGLGLAIAEFLNQCIHVRFNFFCSLFMMLPSLFGGLFDERRIH